MKFFKKIFSIFVYGNIEFQRYIDHTWRQITGLPALKKSMITPQLYLGGQYTKRGYKKLNKMEFTGIVNMRKSKAIPYEFDRQIKVLHLPTPDLKAPSILNLEKGITFIAREINRNGKVYVHCRSGEGRGPSMVIAYLMSTGMFFEDAYNSVRAIRPFIRITHPQKKVLKQLEKELYPDSFQ
jgi:hypothetical protein